MSDPTILAFDLDGTLADTRRAVEQAYVLAGVCPPEDWWGRPWREWLRDEVAHARKNVIYQEIAPQLITATKLADLCRTNQRKSVVLTGASRPAAEIVLATLAISPVELVCEMSSRDKVERLKRYVVAGTYYDDDPATIKLVKKETKWKTVLYRP